MDDVKKYFDTNQYITKVLGTNDAGNETEIKNDKLSMLVELLTMPEKKIFKEEALMLIKKEKAGELLIKAFEKASKYKHLLVAACWESEINFNKHLLYFVDLALSEDYLISLEAITVISTMEAPFDSNQVIEGINKVKEEMKKINSERVVLLNDLANTLETFLIVD